MTLTILNDTGENALVYHYRPKDKHNPAVPDGLAIISKSMLPGLLEKHKLQQTTKPIPFGATHLEIHQHDLLTPAQKVANAKYPNYDANVADVRIPVTVVLQRTVMGEGKFKELVILSEKRSESVESTGVGM
jgi:hypothetical protein